jgi:tetratricopeptide (TPR) repeat protein
MFDLGFLTIPLLSLLAVFGFSVATDVNMISFDVKTVPEMARNMGFDEKTVRDAIMFRIYDISRVAATSRGVGYSTISDMQNQSLVNISESLGIEEAVVAIQGVLGLIPYRLRGKLTQEGDALYLFINGFSRDNRAFDVVLETDKDVFESAQIIKGRTGGLLGGAGDNTDLLITNAETEIKALLNRGAEAIVDRIDPYLLARYYFVLESRQATFAKTIPQLARCLEVLPESQRHWPLLLWGRVYQFMGEYDKAIEIYRSINQLEPRFPFTQLRWGETLATLGRHQEAIAMYQKAIENSRYYLAYPVARSVAYSLWANSLIALGRMDEAEAVLKKGVSIFSFGNEHFAAHAISHNALGRFLMTYRKDYEKAEYHLRKAIYLDNHPKYYAALQEVIAKRVPGYNAYLETVKEQLGASSTGAAGTAADADVPSGQSFTPVPVPQP